MEGGGRVWVGGGYEFFFWRFVSIRLICKTPKVRNLIFFVRQDTPEPWGVGGGGAPDNLDSFLL